MNKKLMALILAIVVVLVGVGVLLIFNNKTSESGNNDNKNNQFQNNNNNEDNNDSNKISSSGNTAIIYFSATGTTENVAMTLQSATSGDIIEIIPREKYTTDDLSYNNDDCRANKEQKDSSARPKIANKINIEEYDTIYLGYPIWWEMFQK